MVLLHLVVCLYYLYQWWTIKQTSNTKFVPRGYSDTLDPTRNGLTTHYFNLNSIVKFCNNLRACSQKNDTNWTYFGCLQLITSRDQQIPGVKGCWTASSCTMSINMQIRLSLQAMSSVIKQPCSIHNSLGDIAMSNLLTLYGLKENYENLDMHFR